MKNHFYYNGDIKMETELALRAVVRALTSRWRIILSIAVVPVLLTVLAYWTVQPKYSATARILIDPRPRQVLEHEVAQTGMGTSSLGGDILMLDSQARILDSRELLSKVASAVELDRKMSAGNFLMANLRQVIPWIERGPRAARLPTPSDLDSAVERLQSNLRIDRVGNTYIYDVTFTSPDRDEAANVANAVIAAYIQTKNEKFRNRVLENLHALDKQLVMLRTEYDRANAQLLEFRSSSENLGSTSGNASPAALLREIKLNEIQFQIEIYRENLRTVSERIIQARTEQDFPSDTVQSVSRAEPSSFPSGPRPLLLILASALLGMMAGTIFAWAQHLISGTPETEIPESRPERKSTGQKQTYDPAFGGVFAS